MSWKAKRKDKKNKHLMKCLEMSMKQQVKSNMKNKNGTKKENKHSKPSKKNNNKKKKEYSKRKSNRNKPNFQGSKKRLKKPRIRACSQKKMSKSSIK